MFCVYLLITRASRILDVVLDIAILHWHSAGGAFNIHNSAVQD